MSHLTFDEIVEYVSLNKLDKETLLLASKVDTHIRECDECLELVRAVRTIYEEFEKMNKDGNFKDFVNDSSLVGAKTKMRLDEIRATFSLLAK